MDGDARDAAFVAFVSARQSMLLRYAYLLCGDWHRAEDATSTALTKLYLAWTRVEHQGAEDSYARTIVRRVLIDEARRPWRREQPSGELWDVGGTVPAADSRSELLDLLLALPLKQRQCVALRFWLDLSVDDTARELAISAGSVKTHTRRGLDKLRAHLTPVGGPDVDRPA